MIKKHKLFLFIVFVFFIVKIYSLSVEHDIWWDGSVYLGMGKYIYSSGSVGLWEESRPLIWPLMLGFFWKLGLDYILFGKLMVILFSVGILFLTYLIALKLFDEKIALVSIIFLSLSQTFFLFNNIIQTEIPSTFFALLGFYFFIEKRYNFSGLLLGIAFMTRFFSLLFFIPLLLILFYSVTKKIGKIRNIVNFSLFFSVPVIPYLIFNHFMYNNIFHPFSFIRFMK